MSEEKKVIKLTDEQLEQIAGGKIPDCLIPILDPGDREPKVALPCSTCGRVVEVPAESLNPKARCPKCGGKLLKF